MATVTGTIKVTKEDGETQAKFDALKQKLRDRIGARADHVSAVTDISSSQFDLEVAFTLSSV